MTTLDASAAPPGITVLKGEWPGVRMSQGNGDSSSGPTGVPWVDSNGWQVRLALIREPGKPVWIRTEFPKVSDVRRVFNSTAYLLAVVDAAMYGGRWVMDLDAELRGRILGGEKQALETWNGLMAAQRFFAGHKQWSGYRAQAVVGILSDFKGGNEFTGGELLNLTARQNQPYRILAGQESWQGLKAVICADAEAPSVETRRKLIAFAESGGLAIAAGNWTEGTLAESHPRYQIRRVGKGRIAAGDLSDPYQAAADAQILLSHRHDLVRFWNGGSLGSYLTEAATGKGGLLQIVNYAGRPSADPVSVRIAGPYREARIQQLNDAAAKPLKAVAQKEAMELHLPAIPVYAAIELI